MDLLPKQVELQRQARNILKELQLIEYLSKFGKPQIVGSVAMGLMTWPDIDIEVIVDEIPNKEDLAAIAKHLFLFPNTSKFILIDNGIRKSSHLPKDGMYTGFHYLFNNALWEFDIWFFKRNIITGKDDLDWIKQKLTEDNRLIILEIKQQIRNNPKYKKEIFSTDIYKAVLKQGVSNLEGFKEYLRKTSREL